MGQFDEFRKKYGVPQPGDKSVSSKETSSPSAQNGQFDEFRRKYGLPGSNGKPLVKERSIGEKLVGRLSDYAKEKKKLKQISPIETPPSNPSSTPTGVQRLVNQEMKLQSQNRSLEPQYQTEKQAEQDFINQRAFERKNMGVPDALDSIAGWIDKKQVDNPVGRFITRVGSSAGNVLGVDTQERGGAPVLSTGSKAADLSAQILGSVAGFSTNPAQLEQSIFQASSKIADGLLKTKTGSKSVNTISNAIQNELKNRSINISAQSAQRIAQNFADNAIQGAVQNTVVGAAAGNTGLGELAKGVYEGALYGGIGGAALGEVGNAITRRLQKNSVPEEQVKDILALPLGREDAARMRNQLNTNGVIIPEYTPEPLGLPSPQMGNPTTARVSRQTNPYRQQFEYLMSRAQQLQSEGKLTPGREDLELESLWGQMAGREGVSLDELIQRAYPSRTNRIEPNLVQRAQQYQQSREVAGVPLPVKSQSDLYKSGQLGIPEDIVSTVKVTGKTPNVGSGSINRQRIELSPEQAAQEAFNRIPRKRAQVNDELPITNEITPPPVINEIESAKSNWFTDLFGNRGVGISPFGSSRSNKVLSTEDQLVRNPIRNDVKGAVEGTKATARAAYQNFVDYLSPLKKISPEAYDAAIDASRANNLANTIITDKFINNQGQVIGNSLKDIISNTGRGNAKAFDDYLIARHALTRMERGEKVYDDALKMTPEMITQRVATLEQRYPQFKQLGEEWNNYNRNMINNAVEEGLISRNAADAMFEQNPNYAAMRRQFSTSEKLAQPKFGGTGSSFSGQKAPIKEYSPTGSTRRIVSPTRSAMEQAYAFKNAELRNRTMQEIVRSVQLDPDGMKGIVEIVKKPSTSYKSLDDALREGGSDEFIEQLDNDFRSLFQKTKTGEENIVRAMVKGNPVYVKVHDPEAVKALLGMGNEQVGIVLGAMQKLSNATKRGATGLFAPMFAIKNVGADTIQAAIQSPNAVRHLFVDVPTAFISSIGDTFKIPGIGKLAEEFRRAGGEYSGLLKGDRAVNRSLGRLRREPLLSPQGVAKGVYNVGAAPFKALEKVADVTENLNRMAAFNREIRGTNRSPQDVRKAISAARESTVNFSRRGAMSQGIEAFVPYQNAAIQSIQRLGTQIIKHPVKTLAGVGTLVVAPKLYEYSQFNDDPDYQKLPARERYRNLIISKNADGTFNKVPMPPEYEAMAAFITDVLNDVVDKDPQAYKGTLSAIADSFTPPIVGGALQGVTQGGGFDQSLKGFLNSTVLAPAVAIAGNQSFTGAPIVPERLKDVSTKYQYDERTSEIAKTIGDKIGLAPLKVDYIIRAYGGDPARLLLPLNSPVGAGTPKQTLLKNFIVDPVFTNTLSNDYFDAKDKYTKAKNDNSSFGAELPSWYDESIAKLLTSQTKGSVSKQLSALNNDKREVQGDRTLSAGDKAQKLRNIQSQINDIYVDVNSQLESSGYKFPNR